ncbi:MAG: NADH-quinone oxidoreductase subunit NuoB [Propionicimonas sp.]|nr:NADH-quinone oxidoreductase subunit NuoB [Propionicimonas sp.]
MRLLSMITRTGTMTEPVADAPIETRDGFVPPACLRGSVQVRHVDAGSCNGCEIELGAAFGPVYDAERFGARLVASPRHADVVTVTGVVTQNMVEPLLNTIDATPNPRVIVSIGDCTRGCGVFAGSYAVAGSVDDFVEVDVHVPGCPPAPEAIIAALRAVTRR